MEEDVIGTQRAVIGSKILVQCSRCGKPTPRNKAAIMQTSLLSDSNSEFEYLCQDCQKAVATGEDLPEEP